MLLVALLFVSNLAWLVAVLLIGKARRRPKDEEEEDFVGVKAKDASLFEEAGGFVPYDAYIRRAEPEMVERARSFYEELNARRTVRQYSSEPVPSGVIEDCIRAAGTAPSGANLQPWSYVVVTNRKLKEEIRAVVEHEEALNYSRRMRESWRNDLVKFGTDHEKPYLEEAPCIVCVFKQVYRLDENNERSAVYYPEQSVGISVGMFQAALHHAGLVTLTSTPMGAENAIRDLCERPANERLYLLMPVGYPAPSVQVPKIKRKEKSQILTWMR
ncbi:Iodotyrosine dehalogenase 1-like protein [Diplonema papillatum]|nr:Iodotyrosine dehalogenase 1-like protein [Diplonema papillatum]